MKDLLVIASMILALAGAVTVFFRPLNPAAIYGAAVYALCMAIYLEVSRKD